MRRFGLASVALAAFLAPLGALAQSAPPAADAGSKVDTLEKLQGMQSTGTAAGAEIPQTGKRADAIRKTLSKIKLPAGFKIDLYAIVPDARQIAVGPNAGVLFVGTRKTKVYTVTDRDKDRVADEVRPFAPGVTFHDPNGVCFSRDGVLFIAELNRLLAFPAAEFFYENPDVALNVVVKQGELIPPSEESFNHSAHVCKFGPDGKIYIALGQPHNVPPKEKLDLYHKTGLGGIIRMDPLGKDREVYATGIRNSVGIDFSREDKSLWFTDNQVDGMGDDQPPGELNRASKAGENFGFPWYGGGKTRTVEYKDETPPKDVVFPQAEMPPHAADLGMTFYNAKMFPESYRGGIFTAEHGSWNRTQPLGARVMFTPVKDGKAGEPKPFAEGWLTGDGEYLGRPVDVAVLQDGSLLVSDDTTGAIYRISYEGK
ncbi:sorbosone dehydrogenase [Methylobacterium sp. C25]|uniref:PQQ-dependent sugar dehydrogenase n=1 Tax=Methylobacterium sp. C25 TaxID=2721622 RepID=UPI001F3B8F0F|nr:PQQ-dependent sugar dehydrogenase [Methylobacterium sp. C25]MCE4223715.1 sorbosone dehydrogenase [Methylobacterium sp. C25]